MTCFNSGFNKNSLMLDDKVNQRMKIDKTDSTPDSFTYNFTDAGEGELLLDVSGRITSGNVSLFLKDIIHTLIFLD